MLACYDFVINAPDAFVDLTRLESQRDEPVSNNISTTRSIFNWRKCRGYTSSSIVVKPVRHGKVSSSEI